MKPHRPSRTLNENAFLLGLNFTDLVALAILLICLQMIFKPFHLEFYALVVTAVVLVILMPIRMRFRRRIIRDAIYRVIGPGVIYVSKNIRKR